MLAAVVGFGVSTLRRLGAYRLRNLAATAPAGERAGARLPRPLPAPVRAQACERGRYLPSDTDPMNYPEARAVAMWLTGLAEPSRLLIVRALAGGAKTVGELSAAAGLTTVNASGHLAALRAAGVADSTRSGRHQVYRLLGAAVTDRGLVLRHESGFAVVVSLAASPG